MNMNMMMMMTSSNNGGGEEEGHSSSRSGRGPCGACKYLRRKCVKGCVFAAYFEGEEGAMQFAAVHKVFGASNASKLLQRLPPHARLHAVVSLSYEALSRLRDPVYGCVAHLFSLQHQVVKLQAELAYVQARLSTLQRSPFSNAQASNSSSNFDTSASDLTLTSPSLLMQFEQPLQQGHADMNGFSEDMGDGDLHAFGRQLESRYALTGQRFRSSTSH